MKKFFFLAAALAFVACSHQETTTGEARAKLDETYENRIGKATKADLVQDFGTPEWCRPQDTGEEICRFYRKEGTKWMGPTTDRTHYDVYDQIVATFDPGGVLRTFKATSQR